MGTKVETMEDSNEEIIRKNIDLKEIEIDLLALIASHGEQQLHNL
jgi:hypothetical protein